MGNLTCCFIGHREINETGELKARVIRITEELITKEGAEAFLFGSKSRFNSLCYEIVSNLKKKYPHIKRIYVRAEYPVIDENYKGYLLERYEDTYYPEKANGAGKSVYIERNREMIKRSDICVIYYNRKSAPAARKSGAEIALDYAVKLKKRIINPL